MHGETVKFTSLIIRYPYHTSQKSLCVSGSWQINRLMVWGNNIYDVLTWRSVRLTTVAVEKQYLFHILSECL